MKLFDALEKIFKEESNQLNLSPSKLELLE